MAGTLASLVHELKKDFRGIDPDRVRVILATASDRVLPSYKEDLSRSAEAVRSHWQRRRLVGGYGLGYRCGCFAAREATFQSA